MFLLGMARLEARLLRPDRAGGAPAEGRRPPEFSTSSFAAKLKIYRDVTGEIVYRSAP
jgi:hypothetical protein